MNSEGFDKLLTWVLLEDNRETEKQGWRACASGGLVSGLYPASSQVLEQELVVKSRLSLGR